MKTGRGCPKNCNCGMIVHHDQRCECGFCYIPAPLQHEQSEANKKINQAAISMNLAVFQAFMTGVETGYILCEKNHNIQTAREIARRQWEREQ